MTDPTATPDVLRGLLSQFGALRPQTVSDWTGEGPLPSDLARFYAEVGPWGEDGPMEPSGLWIPSYGNNYQLPPLSRLRSLQAGYRWDGNDGGRLPDWPDGWLVVAEQGGDPFIFDCGNGTILHAHHGEGAWTPAPLFPDVFAMAAALGSIGAMHDEAGPDLVDDDCVLRPIWQAALRARLVPFLGAADVERAVVRLEW